MEKAAGTGGRGAVRGLVAALRCASADQLCKEPAHGCGPAGDSPGNRVVSSVLGVPAAPTGIGRGGAGA